MATSSTSIVNLSKVEESLGEINGGQKAIGQTLGEIKDRQDAQNDRLTDISTGIIKLVEGQERTNETLDRMNETLGRMDATLGRIEDKIAPENA